MAINISAGAVEPAKPELFRLPWIVDLLSGAWLGNPCRRNGRRAICCGIFTPATALVPTEPSRKRPRPPRGIVRFGRSGPRVQR